MAYILNEDTWEKTTAEAKKRYNYLEKVGYLHSDYDRFEEISNYKTIYYENTINKLAKAIIDKQEERENKIYSELGVDGIDGLNKYFFKDEAIKTFIEGSFNNLHYTVAKALKDSGWGKGGLNQLIDDNKKRVIEDKIEANYNNTLKDLTDDYKDNLNKIINNNKLSGELIGKLKQIKLMKDNSFKTAQEYASSGLGQWKGSLLENCLGMCAAQFGKVKKVEITGSNLDSLNKFVKSDVTFYTESMDIGVSAKNYSTLIDENGNAVLKYDLSLHGGVKGTYFENFLQRLESLKSDNFQNNLNTITKRFRTNNYYYNLINEAARKFSFKTSAPAEEFVSIVKGLAAAWFGTQLVTDTKEGNKGQNVDFFVISNHGFIPMSKILFGLLNETASLSVNINSTADINTDNIYEQKIEAQHGPRMYTGEEVDIGINAGTDIYKGIKVSPIKLKMILNQFI